MPSYTFVSKDGRRVDRMFSISKRPDRVTVDGVAYEYDMAATLQGSAVVGGGPCGAEWATPKVSRALGVHPDQVAEQKAQFPHHEFNKQGHMVFRSERHHQQCLRDIGMVDKN